MLPSSSLMVLKYIVSLGFFVAASLSLNAQPNCLGSLSENALPDGDFGSGPPAISPFNTGIAPGYTYQPNPPPNDGFYTIASTTNFGFGSYPCWLITGDNSNDPDGYMMIVNASNDPGIFFRRRVQVCENTTYLFQADILNLLRPICFGNDPEIDFLIDGEVLFQSGRIDKTRVWQTYGFTFETGEGVSEIELSLRNNAPGGEGNDLALDNIGFFHCGPLVEIAQEGVVCEGGLLELEATLSEVTYENTNFQWQQSEDMGLTWIDIPAANSDRWIVPEYRDEVWYRLLVANSATNLQFENCRTTSPPFVPQVLEASESFLEFDICSGDSIALFDTLLSDAGIYEFRLTNAVGCDSIVLVDVSVFPSFRDTTLISFLCPESTWEGNLITQDTLLENKMQTVDGCDSVIVFDIKVYNREEVDIAGDSFICRDEQAELNALEGFESYLWSTGENAKSISVGAGVYFLTITDVNGCETVLSKEVLEVELDAVLEVSDEICPQGNDGVVEILEVTGGTAPYTFSINDQLFTGTQARFDGLPTGTYNVFIQDSLGCLDSIQIVIREAPVLTSEVQINAAEGITLGDAIPTSIQTNFDIDSIQWFSDGEISCFVCPSMIWTPTLEGLLSWSIVSTDGCKLTGDTLFVPNLIRSVYFPTAFSPGGDQINDIFRPYFSQSGTIVSYFRIYSRWGSQLFEQRDVDGFSDSLGWDGRKDGRDVQPGLYIYSCQVLFPDGEVSQFEGSVMLIR